MRQARISRSALRHNLGLLKKAAGVPVMALVKAEAYGHGAAAVAGVMAAAGVESFGVATLEEGLGLRKAGIKGEIVVLGGMEVRALPAAAAAKIAVTAWSRAYLKAAARLSRPLDVHLKVDTGMVRLGFQPRELPPVLEDFSSGRMGRLRLASAYTHFACADEARDRATRAQLESFLSIRWPSGLRLHAANSAAALRYPEARLDMVRSGILLYGALDLGVHRHAKLQKPALRFSTQVLRLRTVAKGQGVSYGHTFKARRATRVATLAAGYADGVPRLLSNRGEVLVSGRRCRIIGRVCMDLCMADVTGLKARPGDEAVLIGAQGAQRVTANEWAALTDTNSYEVLCGISTRVARELVA